ncbi:MAG: preprotein translocase subunit SecE [Bacteroidetes bacterium QS_8_68_28]|jgi:preprotein translocase subunit SecE|nr:MAG: preprotein translocase subunit SecE [Bacteroidetes bacterium QS_8_68_28]
MGGVIAYLEDVASEMRKVNWPSQQELIDNTIIVIVASLVVSFVIFGADQVISYVLNIVYSLAQ